ncbi:MAG TPA: DEAD/DEAH box helicase, partial [Methanoregulaceae archaeon]|nr:DEAD/DEAH box helicase [Methanoregulaceae archaeon]
MSPIRNLDERILACIRSRGFEELSEIQNRAIPLVASGRNLILIAPTGTGKTESAMIPVFDQMLKERTGGFT